MGDATSTMPDIVKSGPLEVDQNDDSSYVITNTRELSTQFGDFKDAVEEESGSNSDASDDDDGEDDLEGVKRFFTDESADHEANSGEAAAQLKSEESTDEYILQSLGEQSGNGSLVRRFEGWLGKDVSLQGKIYVTRNYFLFYAPSAPPALDIVRASPLAKKSVRMIPVIGRASYSRHWFVLRMGTFAWYNSSADIYFPMGSIPSHTVQSVDVLWETPEKFIIRCENGKSYSFKADSSNTAHQWCKAIKKEVFKARNKNSKSAAIVRIPLQNISTARDQSISDFGRVSKMKVVSEVITVEPESPSSDMKTPPPQQQQHHISSYAFLFFGRGKESGASLDVLESATNHFSNHSNVFSDETMAVDKERSVFGPISIPVLDTTPAAELEIHTHVAEGAESTIIQHQPAGLHPSAAGADGHADSSASSLSTPTSSVNYSGGESPSVSRSGSSSRSASTRALKHAQHNHHHHLHFHHHLHLSKINILSSLTHKLHIHTDDKPDKTAELFLPYKDSDYGKTESSNDEDESDNEEDADSDSEEAFEIPEELECKKYKTFFEDPISAFSPHSVAKKSIGLSSRNNSSSRVPSLSTARSPASRISSTRPSGTNTPNAESSFNFASIPGTPIPAGTPILGTSGANTPSAATSAVGTPRQGSPGINEGDASPSLVRRERTLQQNEVVDGINRWFRDHFGLDRDSFLFAEYMCNLCSHSDNTNWSGRLFIANHFLCFQRRQSSSSRWRMVIPLRDIIYISELDQDSATIEFEVAEPAYGKIRISFPELSIAKGAEDTLRYAMSQFKPSERSNASSNIDDDSESRFLEYSLRSARLSTYEPSVSLRLKHQIPPLMFDPTSTQFKEAFLRKPMQSLKFAMLMIGSRGDVQPYIALSQGLMEEGHKCVIISHKEFRPWVESYGIEFREIAGDPSESMEIMISHGSISYGFVKDASSHFKGWLKELMRTSWHAMEDSGADVLIESPSSMIGIHIAEALDIPYFRAFTMPWTRTKAYPQALVTSDQKKGGAYNSLTYAMYDRLVWFCISKYVNKWRKKHLGLPDTSLDSMAQDQVPFLYCVSPTVLVPPLDQFDWVHSCGYWESRPNKHEKKKENDPKSKEFIAKAKHMNKKIVYIGFGSIIVSDPDAMTRTVVDATKDAGVCCILARGWSSRNAAKKGSKDKAKEKTPIKEEHVFEVDSVDHQWLFPQIDVCVHHGGSGTTGASLRAGKPTIIKPFFGDQFFYAARVEDLNVGVNSKVLNTEDLANALEKCTGDRQLIRQASVLGEQIRHEHGVEEAILAIYQESDYARDVTERRRKQTKENAEAGIFPDPKVLSQLPGFGLSKMATGEPDISNLSWFQLPTSGRREEQRRRMSKSGKIDVSL